MLTRYPVHRACLKISGYRGHWPGLGRPRDRDKVCRERASLDLNPLIFSIPHVTFFSFSKLSVLTLKHVQSTRTSFGFQKNHLDALFVFFFFFLWSKRLFAELGWPWRPTPTERKVNVTFVWCFHSLRQRLGSFLLWKSVERQYFFKEDI